MGLCRIFSELCANTRKLGWGLAGRKQIEIVGEGTRFASGFAFRYRVFGLEQETPSPRFASIHSSPPYNASSPSTSPSVFLSSPSSPHRPGFSRFNPRLSSFIVLVFRSLSRRETCLRTFDPRLQFVPIQLTTRSFSIRPKSVMRNDQLVTFLGRSFI